MGAYYLIGMVLRGVLARRVARLVVMGRGSVVVMVVRRCASMVVRLSTAGVRSIVPTLVWVGLLVVGVRWSSVPGLVVGLAGLGNGALDWLRAPLLIGPVGMVWAEAAVAVPISRAAASRKFSFIARKV